MNPYEHFTLTEIKLLFLRHGIDSVGLTVVEQQMIRCYMADKQHVIALDLRRVETRRKETAQHIPRMREDEIPCTIVGGSL